VIGVGDDILEILLVVSGWVVIGLSVLFFILSLVSYIKAVKNVEAAAPVETTAEETTAE